MTHVDRQTVANTFGEEFADALLAVEPGKWSGPLKSGYRTHFVVVSARETARKPAFEAVRDKVVGEWRRESEQKVSQDYLARLREKNGGQRRVPCRDRRCRPAGLGARRSSGGSGMTSRVLFASAAARRHHQPTHARGNRRARFRAPSPAWLAPLQ